MGSKRFWIDELSTQFAAGAYRPLSAAELRHAIDWIGSQPAVAEEMDRVAGAEREKRLEALVRDWNQTRHA